MRKVKYFVANSLDNYIARKDGGMDWLFMDGTNYGMDEFFGSIDAVLLGRKTYEFALSQNPRPKKKSKKAKSDSGMKSYVFSQTIKDLGDEDAILVSESAGEFVRNLKKEAGKDIWLMGGGGLVASLLTENVVDELSLNIHPVLLGSGVPLFPEFGRQLDLELRECKAHKNGCVQVTYHVKN
jgi:dihydrofolate reductase